VTPAAPPLRTRLRALRMGLSTVLGGPRRGWFIPYRYAAGAAPPPCYPELESAFAAAEPTFAAVLAAIGSCSDALLRIGGEPPPAPRWAQSWFPRLDAAAAYAIVRTRAPVRIVEVGSGHSTRFMARAVADGGLATGIVAIDPAPRASIAALGVEHVAATVQTAPRAPFDALSPGDVLFVDSSHVLMPGSDVDHLLNRVWPALPAGVLVHVHDVLLPDAYPAEWAWRGYNEQSAVAPLISSGGARLLFASHYVATRMADAVSRSAVARLPLPDGALETSLWLEKA
jgi:hypothetical protein